MAAQATGLDSGSLALRDGEPANDTLQRNPVSNEIAEKGIVHESYNLGVGDEDPTTDELHGPNALRRVSAHLLNCASVSPTTEPKSSVRQPRPHNYTILTLQHRL